MKSTRWVFLALAILASMQVLWWAYLVIHQQSTIADLIGTAQALEKARSYRIMVIFEGAFFLFVWALGVWYAYKSIRTQMIMQEERRSFLSAITHELKTPLSTIQLSLETINRPQVTEEQRKNFISRSLQACKKLFHEIETILTYNESERLSPKQAFAVNDFIQDIKQDVSDFVKIKNELTSEVMIYASYPESKAILKSILDNAVKYSANADLPEVILQTSVKDSRVEFKIKDNGIGLNSDELQQVFTPFWRSSTAKDLALEGSGLGLTLSSKLARKNKINLEIRSEGLGKGTEVLLAWPIYKGGSNAES